MVQKILIGSFEFGQILFTALLSSRPHGKEDYKSVNNMILFKNKGFFFNFSSKRFDLFEIFLLRISSRNDRIKDTRE